MNRVTKKATVPDPDYQGEDLELFAAKCWKSYLERNKSIIVDLFQVLSIFFKD